MAVIIRRVVKEFILINMLKEKRFNVFLVGSIYRDGSREKIPSAII